MRYLNLSIILSLLSFNSYGTPNNDQPFPLMDLPGDVQGRIIAEAVLDDPQTVFELSQVTRNIRNIIKVEVEKNPSLKERRNLYDWIESAQQAGLSNQEPDHLLKILEIEKVFFAEFIRQKESTIGNDPVEWKKHALASLLSYSATWTAAWTVARSATRSAAWTVARSATWTAAWTVARSAAEEAVRNAARSAAWTVARNVAEEAARNAARSAAYNVAEEAASIAARSAARSAAYNAAYNAANGLSDYNEIGRVAYRVAETQAWITVLDASLNIFQKSYNATYSKLSGFSEEDSGEWFISQEAFESKLNEYFVNREGLNDRSKEFLEHLLDHLNRMIPKIFPSNEI